MPRSTKKSRTLATIKQPVTVQVRRPDFELLDSVRLLDLDKLSRTARAEIEVGYVKTDCCTQLVRAIVRKGMVTELRVEPFSKDESTPVSPALKRLLNLARAKAKASGTRPARLPMPVAQFMQNADDISITVITCFQICLFGWCIACCVNGDYWFCGKVTVDTTKIPYPE